MVRNVVSEKSAFLYIRNVLKWVYDITIYLYGFLIFMVSPFHPKAREFIRGRKLQSDPVFPHKEEFRVWIHASSLGEFEQVRPLIERLNTDFSAEIYLTFFSPSGFQIRKDYDLVKKVLYLPLDTYPNANRWLKSLDPDLVIFVKYDFWINYLSIVQKMNRKMYFISSIFRKNQFHLTVGRSLYVPVFRKIDHFFVQDQESCNNLKNHGISRASVVGDTRVDRVIQIAEIAKKNKVVISFKSNNPIIVFGSTWPSDIELVRTFILDNHERFNFIIAPHDVGQKQIDNLTRLFEDSILYSRLSSDVHDITQNPVIIDSIGLLASLYSVAKYAFVGGALRGALHNTLEPSVYRIPVFFGKHKNNSKFQEVKYLLQNDSAFEVSDSTELSMIVGKLEKDPKMYDEIAENLNFYFKSNQGATDKIVDRITSDIS